MYKNNNLLFKADINKHKFYFMAMTTLLQIFSSMLKLSSILTKMILFKSVKLWKIVKLYGITDWIPQLLQLLITDSCPVIAIALFETVWVDLTNIFWTLEEYRLMAIIEHQHPEFSKEKLDYVREYVSEVALERGAVASTQVTVSGALFVIGLVILKYVLGAT